jgi:hypothetical protein
MRERIAFTTKSTRIVATIGIAVSTLFGIEAISLHAVDAVFPALLIRRILACGLRHNHGGFLLALDSRITDKSRFLFILVVLRTRIRGSNGQPNPARSEIKIGQWNTASVKK